MKNISIKEAFSTAWQIYRKNWKMISLFMIGSYIVVGIVIGIFGGMINHNSSLAGFLNLVKFVLQAIVTVGVLKMSLHLVDGKKIEVSQVYSYYRKAIPYFIVSFLYGLIVLGGFILLVIPGIIWAVKYQFASFYIIDHNIGIMESFKKSAHVTRDHKMDLILLNFALLGINILGFMLFGFGLLVSGPVSLLAFTHVYRKLSG